MDKLEYKFQRQNGSYDFYSGGIMAQLCRPQLRKFFEVPVKCTKVVTILSKRKRINAYLIQDTNQWNYVLLDGHRIELYNSAYLVVRRALADGFKYIQLEYES